MTLIEGFAAGGVRLPVRVSPDPEEIGVIVDADGRDFLTIDVNGERSDAEAAAIAMAVVDAMNLGAAWGGGARPGRRARRAAVRALRRRVDRNGAGLLARRSRGAWGVIG